MPLHVVVTGVVMAFQQQRSALEVACLRCVADLQVGMDCRTRFIELCDAGQCSSTVQTCMDGKSKCHTLNAKNDTGHVHGNWLSLTVTRCCGSGNYT